VDAAPRSPQPNSSTLYLERHFKVPDAMGNYTEAIWFCDDFFGVPEDMTECDATT